MPDTSGWKNSKRQYPRDWQRRKRQVFDRDNGICHVCGKPGADQLDHITPISQGGTHDLANLAPIHLRPCHMAKISAEANAHRPRRKRAPEPHPGLLR